MNATRILKDEHRIIERALNVIEHMAAVKESGGALDSLDVEDMLRIFQRFADSHHQGKEEMILFPALLKDPAQRHHAELSQLIFAHNQERSLVDGLEDAYRTHHDSDFVYYAKRLLQILRSHLESEDRRLFALADATLSAEDDAAVAKQLKDFELDWRDSAFTGLLQRLSEIERKFARGI